jgi:hypothetical protein
MVSRATRFFEGSAGWWSGGLMYSVGSRSIVQREIDETANHPVWSANKMIFLALGWPIVDGAIAAVKR